MYSRRPTHIEEITSAAALFSNHLDRVRQAHGSTDFSWYPYSTLAVFPVLATMLRVERRDLLTLASCAPVLDIGCGDGALSFFLESMGYVVKAIDQPSTNYNRTRGFKTLRAALDSSVDLETRDLDIDLGLREHTYGLAFCLGVLYHLKNPFGFLEALARHVRYCVLSTRIAQVTARGTEIENDPVAVLLGPGEANNDPSNYWIFSEAGLRLLFSRTGWDLCDYATTGRQRGSDPVHGNRDQRAFCMIRSKQPDPWVETDLAGGWHAMENGSWRWTERVFAVRLSNKPSSGSTLRFRFNLPESLLRAVGPIRLQAEMAGLRLPSREYASSGEQVYAATVQVGSQADDDLLIRFELDKALSPSAADIRELGVQVVFWSYDGSSPRPICPITFG